MTIGILVTNYNTWSLTSECIRNCLKYADDRIDQFVVVDDCSTERYENQFKEITLIRHGENKGLVKSLNTGLAALNTDIAIIFDSDAWPLENYIVKTKTHFSANPQIGIAAYDTVNANGKLAASYEAEPGAMSIILGQELYARYSRLFEKNPKKITVYTCAMVIRMQVAKELGGFDESYDWLDLDHDISMSAMRKGWEIGVVPVRALHKGSGTPQKVSHRVIRFYKNRMKLLKKFNKYPVPFLLNSIIITRLGIEWALLHLFGRWKFKKEIWIDKVSSRTQLLRLFYTGKI